MEDGGRGFALILMPGKVVSLFGWDRPKIFVLRVIEKWSIHGVDIVGVESLGHLLGRTLRLAVVIVQYSPGKLSHCHRAYGDVGTIPRCGVGMIRKIDGKGIKSSILQ